MIQIKVKSYKLNIDRSIIADLKRRINAVRWPDEAANVGWDYGVPFDYLKFLTEYWQDGYDWYHHENKLNSLHQFSVEIEGHPQHFIHQRSTHPDALPLLLLHGWPGSIIEFVPMIHDLVYPPRGKRAFHVIIPTLPGFGFSGPADDWHVNRCAKAFDELMRVLEYGHYFVHGSDVGSLIAREMGLRVDDALVAIHVTQLFHGSKEFASINEEDAQERLARDKNNRYQTDLQAYAFLQATRPQSLAYALNDSPVGLLAWIIERFYDWTQVDKLPHEVIDKDLLLTNVIVYWLNGTIGSSMRYYAKGSASWQDGVVISNKPTALLQMPDDITHTIKRIAILENRIFHWTEAAIGGHFCAFEQPDLLVADLRESFHSTDIHRRFELNKK